MITLSALALYIYIVYEDIFLMPSLHKEHYFRPSYAAKYLDDFQYKHQCCGWESPDDYAIVFPQSCCGRKKESEQVQNVEPCDNPYPHGCQHALVNLYNTTEAWRILCDCFRLVMFAILFLFFLKIFIESIIERRQLSKKIKKIEEKLIKIVEFGKQETKQEIPDQCASDEQCSFECDEYEQCSCDKLGDNIETDGYQTTTSSLDFENAYLSANENERVDMRLLPVIEEGQHSEISIPKH